MTTKAMDTLLVQIDAELAKLHQVRKQIAAPDIPARKPKAKTMDSIISQIDAELAKLIAIRKLLAGSGTVAKKATAPAKVKRTMSPEGRAKIAEAQRKRWAAAKKAAK